MGFRGFGVGGFRFLFGVILRRRIDRVIFRITSYRVLYPLTIHRFRKDYTCHLCFQQL